MSVKFNREARWFEWLCAWGCNGWGYDDGAKATRAFNLHTCINDIEAKGIN